MGMARMIRTSNRSYDGLQVTTDKNDIWRVLCAVPGLNSVYNPSRPLAQSPAQRSAFKGDEDVFQYLRSSRL